LSIVIAGGLKSSIFQGNVIIGINNFVKYFPSVSGSTVILADGDPGLAEFYRSFITERLENKGVNVELTSDRLASFSEVTNTYLSVFMVLGGLGMITGIVGLGFILMRNYNFRRKEFALMLSTGFTLASIRKMIIREQVIILLAGLTTGFVSAVVATLPSVSGNGEVPWTMMLIMLVAIALAGFTALFLSARYITGNSLTSALRME
jgi:ABC-type antimicrobial peptide transport system permease subunit